MKGKYKFRVEGKNLLYNFEIKRNITILRGDSATGKTTLLLMLLQYFRDGTASGYEVETDANYYVFINPPNVGTWYDELSTFHNTIIFIEENNNFVRTRSFAKYVKTSDNYFVIVNRDPIKNLAYSTKEIYTLESKPSKDGLKHFYTFKELYTNQEQIDNNFDLIITEDSNSGFQFFKHFFSEKVEQGGGNARVLYTLKKFTERNVLCIVDGAAYGAHIQSIYKYSEDRLDRNIVLWMPESFEYLLLKAGIIEFEDVTKVLAEPYNYIECSKYFSWERFFTDLAIEHSSPEYKYSKKTLKSFYYSEENKEKFRKVIPEDLKKDNNSSTENSSSDGKNKMNLF